MSDPRSSSGLYLRHIELFVGETNIILIRFLDFCSIWDSDAILGP